MTGSKILLILALLQCAFIGVWAQNTSLHATRDSAGLSIVSNTRGGIWTQRTAWTLENELTIGVVDGNPHLQFGKIGGIAVTTDGRIWVLDTQAQELRVFSPTGIHERTLGGEGSGPGELRDALFVLAGVGDTVFVPDLRNLRINRFSPSGETLGSIAVALDQALPVVFKAASSRLIVQQVRFVTPHSTTGAPREDALVLLESDGIPADTMLRFLPGEAIELASSAPPTIRFFAPEPIWEVTDEPALLFGRSHEYRITKFSRSGTPVRVFEIEFEPQAVSERDKAAISGALERAWADAGAPQSVLPQLRSSVHFGSTLPAFANIFSGPDHTTWVQHVQRPSDIAEDEVGLYTLLENYGAPAWDVFDSGGRFLGVVTAPPRFAPRLFRNDRVYGVQRDELGVSYVSVLRVNRPGG